MGRADVGGMRRTILSLRSGWHDDTRCDANEEGGDLRRKGRLRVEVGIRCDDGRQAGVGVEDLLEPSR